MATRGAVAQPACHSRRGRCQWTDRSVGPCLPWGLQPTSGVGGHRSKLQGSANSCKWCCPQVWHWVRGARVCSPEPQLPHFTGSSPRASPRTGTAGIYSPRVLEARAQDQVLAGLDPPAGRGSTHPDPSASRRTLPVIRCLHIICPCVCLCPNLSFMRTQSLDGSSLWGPHPDYLTVFPLSHSQRYLG